VQLRRVGSSLATGSPGALFCDFRSFSGRAGDKWTGPISAKSPSGPRPVGVCPAFLITLSYSRAPVSGILLRSKHGKTFLRGHVSLRFHAWSGQTANSFCTITFAVAVAGNVAATRFTFIRDCWTCARIIISLLVPCQVRAANQKGKVETSGFSMYANHSGPAELFTTLEELNRQAFLWRDQVAHQRPWPDDDSRTVEQVFNRRTTTTCFLYRHNPVRDGIWFSRSTRVRRFTFVFDLKRLLHPRRRP